MKLMSPLLLDLWLLSNIESPWVTWRLHTLERKMESCQQRGSRGSRLRGATHPLKENKPSVLSASCARSSGPTKERSPAWPSSSATAWNRCGPGSPQSDIDGGLKDGTSTEDARRIKDLEQEVSELRRANEILRKASAYFAQAELDRPPR